MIQQGLNFGLVKVITTTPLPRQVSRQITLGLSQGYPSRVCPVKTSFYGVIGSHWNTSANCNFATHHGKKG